MEKRISEELLRFIEMSPTAFHVVDTIKNMLNEQGFRDQFKQGITSYESSW